MVTRTAAMVQVIYPGFSRGSILAQSRTKSPTYQGMPPRKNPMINHSKEGDALSLVSLQQQHNLAQSGSREDSKVRKALRRQAEEQAEGTQLPAEEGN